jgi:hypothetical protein
MQVLKDYCAYADGMIGRWRVKADGHASPSVRCLLRPVLNLFHGEKNNKRWKAEIDRLLSRSRDGAATTVSEVMEASLALLDDEVLDAAPGHARPAFELFAAEQTGPWPPEGLPAACAAA